MITDNHETVVHELTHQMLLKLPLRNLEKRSVQFDRMPRSLVYGRYRTVYGAAALSEEGGHWEESILRDFKLGIARDSTPPNQKRVLLIRREPRCI